MWAFIKRTSVPAANHLVNMAKFCRRVFAFSFKMGQHMGGEIRIFFRFFPSARVVRATEGKLDLFVYPYPGQLQQLLLSLHKNNIHPSPHIYTFSGFGIVGWVFLCVCSGLICWHYYREVGGILFAFGGLIVVAYFC